MKKAFLLLFVSLIINIYGYGQDTIFMKAGWWIPCKIVEVQDEIIYFKKSKDGRVKDVSRWKVDTFKFHVSIEIKENNVIPAKIELTAGDDLVSAGLSLSSAQTLTLLSTPVVVASSLMAVSLSLPWVFWLGTGVAITMNIVALFRRYEGFNYLKLAGNKIKDQQLKD